MKPFTKLDIYRLWSLWSLTAQTNRIPGCVVEVGCWRGGSGMVMARAARGGDVWLYDTFTGCVMAGVRDNLYRGGEHHDAKAADVGAARVAAGWPRATTVVGVFPESRRHRGPVRMAHIDVDTHESALQSFRAIAPDVPLGGVVVFDDYGFSQTRGVQIAVDYASQGGDWVLVHNLNGQAILVKVRPQ